MPECTCNLCVRACSNTPGWFRPGEAEKAAKLLKMSLPKFFKKYCGVNWFTVRNRPIFVLAPAVMSMQAGHEYPGNPKGVCVFLKDERCMIHAAKPYDCASFNVCGTQTKAARIKQLDRARTRTVTLWSKQQTQIRSLLGRKPHAERLTMWDIFSNMLGWF